MILRLRPRRLHRYAAAAVLAAVTAILVCLVAPAPASAHAELVLATPADGQVFARSPERLRLRFTEPVTATVDGIRLYAGTGEPVPTEQPTHPPGDGTTVEVRLRGELPAGRYAVAWRVVSADSHPVRGAYAFTVGDAAGAGPDSPASVGAAAGPGTGLGAPAGPGGPAGTVYGIVRWLAFAALALLVGAVFLLTRGWPAGARQARVRRLVWTGWAASLGGTLAAFLAYGPYLAGLPLGRLLDGELLAATARTRLGVALLVRAGLLFLLAPALAALLRRLAGADRLGARTRLLLPGAVLAAGCALALTWPLANHSAVGGFSAVALAADTVHLVTMAVWLGGLALLGGALLPSRDLGAMRTAVPAFSRSAEVSVLLLVATGMFQLWRQVRTVPALLETSYGRLLLVKVALVVVLLALGAGARAWVRRHYPAAGRTTETGAVGRTTETGTAGRTTGTAGGRRVALAARPVRGGAGGPDPYQLYHFRRRVSVEAALGLAVLGLAAALVATEPARVAYAGRQGATEPATAGAATGTGPPDAGAAGAGGPDGGVPGGAGSGAPAGLLGFDAGSGPEPRGLLALDLQPRRPGPATVHVSVLDPAGRPRAVPELRVSLRLPEKDLGPLPVSLVGAGPGHYVGTLSVPLAGSWEATVTVRTSELDQATVRVPLPIAP